MFSYNYWIGSGLESPHPEDDEIFGSFRDYWDQMSLGYFKIEGRVANPTDESTGVPKWLTADHVKQYYTDTYPGGTLLALEAIQKAINEGYISEDSTDPNYYDNYAVVFAQYPIRGTYNMIGALPNRRWYILGEQMGSEIYNPDETFTHIGLFI